MITQIHHYFSIKCLPRTQDHILFEIECLLLGIEVLDRKWKPSTIYCDVLPSDVGDQEWCIIFQLEYQHARDLRRLGILYPEYMIHIDCTIEVHLPIIDRVTINKLLHYLTFIQSSGIRHPFCIGDRPPIVETNNNTLGTNLDIKVLVHILIFSLLVLLNTILDLCFNR